MRYAAAVVLIVFAIGEGGAADDPAAECLDAVQREDYDTAVTPCTKAAEQGEAVAQYNLGVMYSKGEGVRKKNKTAVEWWQKAAVQGHADAQNNVGEMYFKGKGVLKDKVAARKWYTRAALQGHADAQFNLGWTYDEAKHTFKGKAEAVEWYTKAAEQGHARAQSNLGLIYGMGLGVPKNYRKAFELTAKAAEQGLAMAQYNLGVMYANGEVRGERETYIKAFMWLDLAKTVGERTNARFAIKLAIKNMTILRKRMTPEQMAEGQRLSSEWLQKHKPKQDGR